MCAPATSHYALDMTTVLWADEGRVRRWFRWFGSTRAMSTGRLIQYLDLFVYRVTRGRHTLSTLLAGLPIVLLTTVGAKSGEPRTAPLIGLPDGDQLVLIASNYGTAGNPGWYYNLRRNPEATVTFPGGEPRPVVARLAEDHERERLWALGDSYFPAWARYRRQVTTRTIQMFVLSYR